ncbi:AlpA family transcriptional regulator [Parafrankia sp. BMG5.11]|uniref:helix-turn-helix transcriptional regulator n=1 Tax=Parafrankia sp. BMG5.11 TaxID=222540 RepID=UPI00103EB3FD|nr:AlpA family phage regulatory protein [Parafrankia sp. BMG5.11]
MAQTRFLRRPAVLQKLGISRTHLYELERAGDFPAHFMLSPRCAVWEEAAVDGWMEERASRKRRQS